MRSLRKEWDESGVRPNNEYQGVLASDIGGRSQSLSMAELLALTSSESYPVGRHPWSTGRCKGILRINCPKQTDSERMSCGVSARNQGAVLPCFTESLAHAAGSQTTDKQMGVTVTIFQKEQYVRSKD